MKKIFSGKLWIIPTSILLIAAGIAMACAGGDWDKEYGASNFSPELFVDSSYSPFFYSNNFYYKINYESDQNSRFNNNNSREWAEYLNSLTQTASLDYLLQTASSADIDSAANYFSTGKVTMLPSSMKNFALLKQNGNKRIGAFLHYLQYAKKAESFAVNEIVESWAANKKQKNSVGFDIAAYNKALEKELKLAKDAFIKERYWFQMVRASFYNFSPQDVLDAFNRYEKAMPRNTIYYRSMAYVAGAYYKQKDYSHANYYYSRVYDSCNELKTSTHFSFHPQEEKDWKNTLSLCRNSDEQATLWQMLGVYYADEGRAITTIYQLNPKSEKLDLLLARAINKYEQKFEHTNSYYNQIDTITNKLLAPLIIKIAEAGNTAKPWIWDMATGYIYSLDNNYAKATLAYSRCEKQLPKSPLADAQLRILKMINTIASAKKIDLTLENKILSDLSWLNAFQSKDTMNLRYEDALNWLKFTVAKKYSAQQEWVKSECFSSSNSFYNNATNLEALKAFLQKPGKSPYEQLCADLSSKRLEDLFDYQAVCLAYREKVDSAIINMEKAGKGSTFVLAGNPFNGKIQDCHDCDHAAAQKVKYSRLAFLNKMKEIKDKITSGDDVYNNALLLGNAYYNMSHYGNARLFYEGKILGESQSTPFSIDSVYLPMLTSMKTSSRYYQLALDKAGSDEQRAKCQFMLAKCQRNEWYNSYVYTVSNNQYSEYVMPDFSEIPAFKSLKQYANTQYYKDIILECGYFRKYATK
jgi:hypothetical protein